MFQYMFDILAMYSTLKLLRYYGHTHTHVLFKKCEKISQMFQDLFDRLAMYSTLKLLRSVSFED